MTIGGNIKKAAENVIEKSCKKSKRGNRTLRLDEDVFRELQRHCIGTEFSVSDIVEKLIIEYLKGVNTPENKAS